MARYEIGDLLELMRRLRDPGDGCPWDLAQTPRSLLRHTLEEVYEFADAVERDDYAAMRDELGDYLFQAVFYAQIGAEQKAFDFSDVTHAIVSKLLKRHPHVFPDGSLASRRDAASTPDVTDIKRNWESIKQQDRHAREQRGALDDVPLALPALQRAEKLQRRAADTGFDWHEWRAVLDKLHEEAGELVAAADSADESAQADELGDLLFTCVNLARHLRIDPETALRRANAKFETRFRALEADLAARGLRPQDCDMQALDEAWNRAKQSASRGTAY
jgi:nucleoside triphosphate diphosphatase